MSDAVDATFDLTFYVPCLNEAENVGGVVEEVAAAARRRGLTAEILVFDDGSTDGTGEVARAALDRVEGPDLRVELIRRDAPHGLGANFFDGARRGRGEHYLLVNGDGSERPETLDAVLSRVGDADLVVTFFADGDRRGYGRRTLSRLFTGLVNRLNGHRLRYYNGPVLHRRLDVVDLATDSRGFAYQAELLTRELDAGRSAVEVPMVNRQRDAGTTKAFAPSNLLSVARSLWRIHFRRFEAAVRTPVRWSAAAVLGLLLPLMLAAGLRLGSLGEHDIRSDEIGLLLRLSQGPSLSEIYADHLAQFAQFRQMPIPRLAARAVTSLTPDIDIGSVRLASAVAGVLAVAALWWLGFEVGGVSLATPVALYAAVNPFHLAWSRAAQVFSFSFLFCALFTAAVAAVTVRLLRRGHAGFWPWAVATVAAVGASYSHLHAWVPVLVGWGVPIAAARGWRGERGGWGGWIYLGPAVWLLTLTPWAWAWLAPQLDGSVPLWTGSAAPTLGRDLLDLWALPFTYAFGTGWRGVVSLGLPALALLAASTRGRARPLAAAVAPVFVVLTVQQVFSSVDPVAYAPLWPLVALVSGLGLLALRRFVSRFAPGAEAPPVRRIGPPLLVSSALLAVAAGPALAVLALRGSPVEYSRLARALDELVAEGVPALVNGQSVVELEMRPHRPEKAALTFTVPDAGYAEWSENDWRGTAESFLRRFPDAPLVQQGRNYYDLAGPWSFPGAYFAQRLVLRNEPAIYLAERRLAPTRDFYTSRTVTEISYNRPGDLVARARSEGARALALFGDGWGYFKTTELEDWRLLRDRADVAVHNLTDEPLELDLVLEIDLPTGLKRVRLGRQIELVESANQSTEIRFRLALPPGEHVIPIVDDHFDLGRAALPVGRLRVEPVAAPPARTPE